MLCITGLVGVAAPQARAEAPDAGPVQSLPIVNAEILQPEGCSWRETDDGTNRRFRTFTCEQAGGMRLLTLWVRNRDYRFGSPEDYFDGLRRGWTDAAQGRGHTLTRFSYAQAGLTRDAFRFESEETMPSGGSVFGFGYVIFYDRSYTLFASATAREEPAFLLATAKSVRLLRPPASPRTVGLILYAAIGCTLALMIALQRWTLRRRRARGLASQSIRITFNGQTYDSPAALPLEARALYERAMANLPLDSSRPLQVQTKRIFFDGREYGSAEELPKEARAAYDLATASGAPPSPTLKVTLNRTIITPSPQRAVPGAARGVAAAIEPSKSGRFIR